MTDRRTFLKQSAGLVAIQMLLPIAPLVDMKGKLQHIGIGLFSLPKLLEEDLVSALQLLRRLGYSSLELYGPYPFSDQRAKDSWNAVTPALGFGGSGYFGKDIREFKSILNDQGMTAPSAHTDIFTLQNHMGALAEASQILGHKYVTLPSIPPEFRTKIDDYYRTAELFNRIGEDARKEGIQFAYHNHGYGIVPLENGMVPLEILIENTDPSLVFLEMDIYWTAAGGADPVAYLKKYPDRYKMMHVKDMKPKAKFSGDGGDPAQWIELFPNMTTAGSGDLDISTIVKTGLETGVEHFFVEQDMVANPAVALKESIDFLKSI